MPDFNVRSWLTKRAHTDSRNAEAADSSNGSRQAKIAVRVGCDSSCDFYLMTRGKRESCNAVKPRRPSRYTGKTSPLVALLNSSVNFTGNGEAKGGGTYARLPTRAANCAASRPRSPPVGSCWTSTLTAPGREIHGRLMC